MAAIPQEPGRRALMYDPSVVSWAVAEAIARPPAWLSRLSVYLMVTFLAAAGIFSYYAKVSITVSSRGIIRSSEKSLPIRTLVTGKIANLGATNGQRVKRGAVLIEMEQLITSDDLEHATAMVDEIERLLARADRPDALAAGDALVGAPPRLSGSTLVKEYTSLTEALKTYVQALRYEYETTPALNKGDLFEKRQVQQKIQNIKRLRLQSSLASDLSELQTSLARLSASVTGREADSKRQVESARTALQSSVKAFQEAVRMQVENQRLVSPLDGLVAKVAVAGQGELVTAGQELLQIVPEGGQLVAEVDIANKDIGEIRAGLPVLMRLDAFPFQDYGTLGGKVAEVPHDVRAAAGPDSSTTYQVIVALDRTYMDDGHGERKPLLLGMALSADVQVRKRTLLQLAVADILKLKGVLE